MSFLMQAFDMYGAEAGIEPFSLSLKIKEIFKVENFCTSMCTLTGLPMVRQERRGSDLLSSGLSWGSFIQRFIPFTIKAWRHPSVHGQDVPGPLCWCTSLPSPSALLD